MISRMHFLFYITIALVTDQWHVCDMRKLQSTPTTSVSTIAAKLAFVPWLVSFFLHRVIISWCLQSVCIVKFDRFRSLHAIDLRFQEVYGDSCGIIMVVIMSNLIGHVNAHASACISHSRSRIMCNIFQ